MANEWVVVLEVARPAGGEAVEPERIKRLLVALADVGPAALIDADHYALQMGMVADGPAESLLVALSRWRDAAGRLCLPAWDLVRAEVMTAAELERECGDLAGRAHLLADGSGEERGDEADALLEVVFRDPVTGLASQGLFSDSLERALGHGAAVGRVHALLLVGLDGFAAINARSGPAAGDRVLVAAAERLAEIVREADMVARVNTDRFAVLLRNTTSQSADVVAQRLVEQMWLSVREGGTEIALRATVGLAISHPDQTGTDLLQQAAAALMIANGRGGDRSVSFTARSLVPAVAEVSFDRLLSPPETA